VDWTSIIVALIAALPPTLAVVVKSKATNSKIDDLKDANRRDAIRNQILILIMSDRQNVDDGKLPENYKTICELDDEYVRLKGNSYISSKVTQYCNWVDSLNVKKGEAAMGCSKGKKGKK